MRFDFENDKLCVFWEGRIDSANASDVEKELGDIVEKHPDASLEIDAENLEYISSSGLRILMKLRKSKDGLSVKNVSPEVYEVLEMTGFTEILSVKKALRKIDVEGCEIIGKGAMGTVYRLNDETIVKTYQKNVSYEQIDRERALAKLSFVKGISTAIAYDVVKVNDTLGIVFEIIKAESLGATISKNEESRDEYIGKYADLMRQFHETEIKEEENIPSIKSRYHEYADKVADLYSEEEIRKFHRIIELAPDNSTLLHGDFHAKNILVQNGELLVIDMADISTGHPLWDFASIAVVMDERLGEQGAYVTGISANICSYVWNEFLKKYFKTDDEEYLAARMKEIQLFKLLRLGLVQAGLTEIPVEMRKGIAALAKQHLLPNADYLDKVIRFDEWK